MAKENNWAVQQLVKMAKGLREKANNLRTASKDLSALAERLDVDLAELTRPYTDIIDQMPLNPQPTSPEVWWIRQLRDIRGVTIHHTLSHSPINTAKYVIEEKGRPSLPYHFWVSHQGECWLCVPLFYGMWHDHTGHKNINISVGMAGYLHKVKPPPEQMVAAVRLVAWLMEQFNIPLSEVQGHNDRYAETICPGWDEGEGWREHFYSLLVDEIDDPAPF